MSRRRIKEFSLKILRIWLCQISTSFCWQFECATNWKRTCRMNFSYLSTDWPVFLRIWSPDRGVLRLNTFLRILYRFYPTNNPIQRGHELYRVISPHTHSVDQPREDTRSENASRFFHCPFFSLQFTLKYFSFPERFRSSCPSSKAVRIGSRDAKVM